MSEFKRAMALDLGDVRIGIAVSDITKLIASAYGTRIRTNEKADIFYFVELIEKQDVDTVVVGLAVNMDGTEGDRAQKARNFGDKLKKLTNASVVFQDERLSTVSAEKTLLEVDMRRDKRKTVIDMVAATIILQAYLDKVRN